jgi:hypothetical protein
MNTRKTFHLIIALLSVSAFGLSAFTNLGMPAEAQLNQTGIEIADCAADHFLDVQADPANSAYPDPELSVTCDGETVTIHTNNIPNFEFVSITPNGLSAQDITLTIPQNPTIAAQTTDIPLVGVSAITVNGLLIFGPTEAPQAGSRDPYLGGILDFCNGHTAQGGTYHFHARPDCIFEDVNDQVGFVLGYSLDGFPILSPSLCVTDTCDQIIELQSSWQLTDPNATGAWNQHDYVAGSGDLDECNGMFLDDGSYVYFATDTFPYFMGCYVGEVNLNNNALGGGQGQTQGNFAGPNGNQGAPTGNENGNPGGPGLGGPPPGGPFQGGGRP